MEVVGRKTCRVTLSDEERQALKEIQRDGGAAQRRLRAHILLLAEEDRRDGGLTDAAIASVLNVGSKKVERVRERCVMEGAGAAVERREQANRRPQKRDGEAEAKLAALACSQPPKGACAVGHSLAAGQDCRVGDFRQQRSGDGAAHA